MSASVLAAVAAKLATKSSLLAAGGVLTASSVAAAAAGAPVPVIADAFEQDDPPALVEEVDEPAEEAVDTKSDEGEPEKEEVLAEEKPAEDDFIQRF